MTPFKTNTFILFVLCTLVLSTCQIDNAKAQSDELKINLGKAKNDKFKVTYIPPENNKNASIQFRRYSRLCYFPLLKHDFISRPKAYNSKNQRIKVRKNGNAFTPDQAVDFWEYYIDARKYPEYINLALQSNIQPNRNAFLYPSLYYPFLAKSNLDHRISIKDDISVDSVLIHRIDFDEYLEIDEFIYCTKKKQVRLDDSSSISINLLGQFNTIDEEEIGVIIRNIVLAFESSTRQQIPNNFEFNIIESAIEKHNDLPVSAVYKNSISVILENSLNKYDQKELIIENVMWQLFRWLSPIQSHDTSWEKLDPKKGRHSIHLWYYESVSEYLSLKCLMKNKLITESYFTQIIQEKVSTSLKEPSYSLIQLGKDFSSQSGNFHIRNNLKAYDVLSNRGVVTSLIMDITLLKESNGNSGLMDKFLKLHTTYKDSFFPTDSLLGIFASGHGKDFKIVMEKYVLGIDQFHFKSYFELIDWQFFKKGEIHKSFMKRGHLTYFPEIGKYVCTKAGKNSIGLEKGDIILSINNDEQISTMELNEVILPSKGGFRNENRVKLEILRGGKEIVLRGKVEYDAKVKSDIIIPLFNPNTDGYQLRKAMIH